jgi:hypothetical protein
MATFVDQFNGAGFVIVWAALLAGPALGIILALRMASQRSGIRPVFLSGFGCIIFVVALDYLGVRTSSALINMIFWVLVFLSLCLLLGLIWTIEYKPIRVTLGILTHLIFVPGYVLGTIGILGLFFILGDYLTLPGEKVALKPGLTCEVMSWGNSMSQSGYDVSLYRHVPWASFIRLKVGEVTVNQSSPQSGRKSADCKSAAKEFGY